MTALFPEMEKSPASPCPPCLAIDVDGVYIDFVTGANHVCDIPLKHDQVDRWHYYDKYMTWDQYKEAIIHAGQTFWTDLSSYGWAPELHKLLTSKVKDWFFLTDPGPWPDAPAGKLNSLEFYGYLTGNDAKNYVMTGDKERLSRIPNCILIDDRQENVDEWRGESILFPQNWNNNWDKVGDRIGYVKKELTKILKKIGGK